MAVKKKTFNEKRLSSNSKAAKKITSKSLKKVSRDFLGVCELRQLPKGTYFRTVDKNGKMGRETYTKGAYDYAEEKFDCAKHSDIWGNGRALKGTTKVSTNFTY